MNAQATTPEINDRNLAATTLHLLKGVTLTGADVPTFVAIHNWLDAIAQGQLVLAEATAPDVGMTLPRAVDSATVPHPVPGIAKPQKDTAPDAEPAPTQD